jgi:hypothetical protein
LFEHLGKCVCHGGFCVRAVHAASTGNPASAGPISI